MPKLPVPKLPMPKLPVPKPFFEPVPYHILANYFPKVSFHFIPPSLSRSSKWLFLRHGLLLLFLLSILVRGSLVPPPYYISLLH